MTEEVFDSTAVRLGPPPIVLQPPPRSRESSSRRTGSRSPVRMPAYLGPQPTVENILADDSLSYSQKQLAARIDRAAARIKTWCEELENWKWTGSFTPPSGHDRSKTAEMMSDVKDLDKLSGENKEIVWWGALPAVVVREHENRLDAIHDDLVSFDLDDLKERVLDITHNNSRPSSSSSTWTMSSMTCVDDYSYFVTRTLVLTLPHLTVLNRYLKTWNVRLAVLRMVPTYLDSLSDCQKEMENIWRELEKQVAVGDSSTDQEQLRLDKVRESCQSHIFTTSRILDAMLDTLEGHDDVLPDCWIDDFEVLEADLSNWSVAVQNKMIELRLARRPSLVPETENGAQLEEILPEETKSSHDKIDGRPTSSSEKAKKVLSELTTSPRNTEEQHVPLQNHAESNSRDSQVPSAAELFVAEPSMTSPGPLSSKILQPGPEGEQQSNLNDATEPADSKVEHVKREESLPTSEILESISSEKQTDSPNDSSPIIPHIQTSHFITPSTLPLVEVSRRDTSTISEPASPIDLTSVHPETDTQSEYNFEDDISILEELSHIYEISSDDNNDDDDSIYGRELEESPSQRKQTISRTPKVPLNSVMRKRQEKSQLPILKNPTSLTPRKLKKLNVRDINGRKDAELLSPVSPVLPLEQQISNILETISTPIRLKSGPSANAPYIKSSRPLRSPTPNSLRRTVSSQNALAANANNTPPGSRSSFSTHGSGSTPTLTLAPVDDIPRHPRGSNKHSHAGTSGGTNAASRRIHDPDVRLYHLIQTGRTHPIKLFIRRVGENGERVMVRVGGGWADLAEYLKVFAQHHGRRAVSDGAGTVEVLALGNGSAGQDNGSRAPSGRSTPTQTAVPELVRGRRSSTTSNPAMSGSPLVATITSESNPETPNSNSSSSRRPSLVQDSIGSASSLAGPFARKRTGEISDEKQEWVDGIVEQAKRSLGPEMEVGGLGKRGGTRRIFIRKGTGPGGVSLGEKD